MPFYWARYKMTANFDVKFRTKFLYIGFLKIYLFLQKCLPNLFELLIWCQKMMFWHPFKCFFVRSSVAAGTGDPLPFGFTAITDRVREKSSRAIVHTPQCTVTPVNFTISSGPGPQGVWGGGGFSVGPALCSFWVCWCCRTILGKFMKPQRSITHVPNTWSEFTLHKREVKTEQTPVVDRLPGPQLN